MEKLLKKLINAESTAEKGELKTARIVANELKKAGAKTKLETWDKNRANVTAKIPGKNTAAAILFACHLDVVPAGQTPWQHDPFKATVENDRIYGRGACDMKGSIAALITAIKNLLAEKTEFSKDIILFFGAGEETDSCGAKRFVEQCKKENTHIDGVIIPEPTNFEIITAHRGILWLNIHTAGKTAHGSQPDQGVNAITSMWQVINEIEKLDLDQTRDKLLGKTSLSINTIAGGKAINVIPDSCLLGIDIRTVRNQPHEKIIEKFEKIFAGIKKTQKDFTAGISVVRSVKPLCTDTNNTFVQAFKALIGAAKTKAVGFTTDGPHFAELQAPVVVFGPGQPHLCHKPDEYIELKDLRKAAAFYKNILGRYGR